MPTVEEYTDPYITAYTYVPPSGPGVCRVCHGAVSETRDSCWSCSRSDEQVTHPARVVVPISLYRGLSPLHDMLRKYKDGWSEEVRDRFSMRVSAALGRFLRDHEGCISAGPAFDVVTTVPSRKRQHPHPLETAALRVGMIANRFARVLDPGPVEVAHNTADDKGFVVRTEVKDRTVLVLDDTFTSGAALQSAASAIRLAGASDVAAVTVGRYFNPDFAPLNRLFWDAVTAIEFSFDRCCLEGDNRWTWLPEDQNDA